MEAANPIHEFSYAASRDEKDVLRLFRSEFLIPTKADLRRKTLARPENASSEEESIYLCGNSLGLQPKQTAKLISDYLTSWSTKAVTGHFIGHEDAPHIPPYLHVDDFAAELMAPIVGAKKEEVACMGTLTANLHLMMSSFYKPEPKGSDGQLQGRYKIILEGKAFPSDHFAIESQIRSHGYTPSDAMIMISPKPGQSTIALEQIISTIDDHATTTSLILLPGIQFYTGQYFDINAITRHAHSKGILVGWDLAHAVGNVPVKLHEWDVDFAVWCTYKYLNSGPGAIAGLFVHERHGNPDCHPTSSEDPTGSVVSGYRPRLSGWWGADKSTRFAMDNNFSPRTGAAGYQLSNPSALDLTSLTSSLLLFSQAAEIGQTATETPHALEALRTKSLELTSYLETLLLNPPSPYTSLRTSYKILTPSNPSERGAQLSILLTPPKAKATSINSLAAESSSSSSLSFLTKLLHILEHEKGIIIDERKPDVIRVAPAPLYNSFVDVRGFCQGFWEGIEKILREEDK